MASNYFLQAEYFKKVVNKNEGNLIFRLYADDFINGVKVF